MKMHLILAAAFTLAISQLAAWATSFYIRPFSEFTQSAPNVVRGKLTNIHVENSITPEGAKTIFTYANLEIKEVLKGDLPRSQVTIRKIGGSKDGMTLEIPSSPEFVEGEETVLFLSREQDDHSYEVEGLELGKFGLKEENGESYLSGGIFNYSKEAAHANENQNSGTDLSENRRSWSLSQLRTLIQNQSQSVPNNVQIKQAQGVTHQAQPSPLERLKDQQNNATNQNFVSTDPEKPVTSSVVYWGIALFCAIGLFWYFRGR